MGRTDLIHYILENDSRFSMEELVRYTYDELVLIKVRIELERYKSEKDDREEND